MDVEEALRSCGGAARSARLERLVARRALAAAVTGGTVLRPSAGLYVLPGAPADAVAAAAVTGVLSCHSAARAWGRELLDAPDKPHVTTRRGSRATWRGAVVHHRDVGRPRRVHRRADHRPGLPALPPAAARAVRLRPAPCAVA